MQEFSLRDTLESGQVFRWRYAEHPDTGERGAWVCHRHRLFFLTETGDLHPHPDIATKRHTEEAEPPTWVRGFLRRDQPALDHPHPYVREAIAATAGLRVLRQDPWECLVTFIISQNNNVARIRKNCFALSERFGTPLHEGFHAFPLPQQLGTEEELRDLRLGYRARYLARLRDLDLAWLDGLAELPYAEAKEALCTLPGVGPKVADCILLFSLGFDEACPEDTWIKKVFARTGLDREALGERAGLLQQALFHYARTA